MTITVFVGVEGSSDGEKSRLEMERNKLLEDAKKELEDAKKEVANAKKEVALIQERADKDAKMLKNFRAKARYRKRRMIICDEVERYSCYLHQQRNGPSKKVAREIAHYRIKERNQGIHQLTYCKQNRKTESSITTKTMGISIATDPSTATTGGSVSRNKPGWKQISRSQTGWKNYQGKRTSTTGISIATNPLTASTSENSIPTNPSNLSTAGNSIASNPSRGTGWENYNAK